MTITPRLMLAGVRDGERSTEPALRFVHECRRVGLAACVFVVGADRESPSPEAFQRLVRASGHAAHRLDPRVMSHASIRHVVARAAVDVDVVVVVAVLPRGQDRRPAAADAGEVASALECPVFLCSQPAEEPREPGGGADDSAMRRALDAALGHTRARRLRAIDDRALVDLLEAAGATPPLPDPVVRSRRGRRARVGLVLDECFDLYDEEGLELFERAGAELVPVSALAGDPTALRGLDGLLVGDGHVERHSAELARRRRFRAAARAAVGGGLPTIGCGGGHAYLTRGLRSVGGALHPLCGVIDEEAVVQAEPPVARHVEALTLRHTLVGRGRTRLVGFEQRLWITQGGGGAARAAYHTPGGPRDGGYASANVLALHFRPYWRASPIAAERFVDACVSFAASREFGDRTAGAPRASDPRGTIAG